MGPFVCHRKLNPGPRREPETFGTFKAEVNFGFPGRTTADLNLPEAEPVFGSNCHCLHHRFFGGKTSGVMFEFVSLSFAVGTLPGGENPVEKPVTVTAGNFLEAFDTDNVNALTNLHQKGQERTTTKKRTAIRRRERM